MWLAPARIAITSGGTVACAVLANDASSGRFHSRVIPFLAYDEMTDLHWIVPVARWAAIPATAKPSAGLDYIDPMLRRRLSNLSRMALQAAAACLPDHRVDADVGAVAPDDGKHDGKHDAAMVGVRVVFASRHGELRRSTEILRAISGGQPVSPTAFSLSVMNAMTGVFGIARQDRNASSALSAGPETLGYALLEGYAQYVSDPSTPVLVVYADEPADPIFGEIQDEVEGGALAVLISGTGSFRLDCRLLPTVAPGIASAVTAVSEARVDVVADAGPNRGVAVCGTQSAAVRRALAGGIASWRSAAGEWCWSGSDA